MLQDGDCALQHFFRLYIHMLGYKMNSTEDLSILGKYIQALSTSPRFESAIMFRK